MTGGKCDYKNCTKTRKNSNNVFHRFPSNCELSKKWITNSGNIKLELLSFQQLKQRAICSDHFEKKDYSKSKAAKTVNSRLNPNVVPKDYLAENFPSSFNCNVEKELITEDTNNSLTFVENFLSSFNCNVEKELITEDTNNSITSVENFPCSWNCNVEKEIFTQDTNNSLTLVENFLSSWNYNVENEVITEDTNNSITLVENFPSSPNCNINTELIPEDIHINVNEKYNLTQTIPT